MVDVVYVKRKMFRKDRWCYVTRNIDVEKAKRVVAMMNRTRYDGQVSEFIIN